MLIDTFQPLMMISTPIYRKVYRSLIALGITLFLIACTDKKPKIINDLPSLTDYLFDDSSLGIFEVYQDALISAEDREKIWASLSDTTKPIREAMGIALSASSVHASLDLYQTFLEVIAVKRAEAIGGWGSLDDDREIDSTILRHSRYASIKSQRYVDSLFQDKIVYNTRLGGFIKTQYLFLEDGRNLGYSSWFTATKEEGTWEAINDTIHLHFRDTLHLKLVDTGSSLRPIPKNSFRSFEKLK